MIPIEARRMPSWKSIIEWWETHGREGLPNLKSRWIGWGEPFCFACGWLAPVADGPRAWESKRLGSILDKAHLVDHCEAGGGHPRNLVALCHLCHDKMPPFILGQRQEALEWVASVKEGEYMWQLWTDTILTKTKFTRTTTMLRQRSEYLEMMRETEHIGVTPGGAR